MNFCNKYSSFLYFTNIHFAYLKYMNNYIKSRYDMQMTPKFTYLYLQQTLILPLNSLVTVSVIYLAG